MYEYCDPQLKKRAVDKFKKFSWSLIDPGMSMNFPKAFLVKCCPVCGKSRDEHERRPGNHKVTKSMCSSHYHNLILDNAGDRKCMICGDPLNTKKVDAQYLEPGHIRHHIHEGFCLLRWIIIHSISVGEQDIIDFLSKDYIWDSIFFRSFVVGGRVVENYPVEKKKAIAPDIQILRDDRFKMVFQSQHNFDG